MWCKSKSDIGCAHAILNSDLLPHFLSVSQVLTFYNLLINSERWMEKSSSEIQKRDFFVWVFVFYRNEQLIELTRCKS